MNGVCVWGWAGGVISVSHTFQASEHSTESFDSCLLSQSAPVCVLEVLVRIQWLIRSDIMHIAGITRKGNRLSRTCQDLFWPLHGQRKKLVFKCFSVFGTEVNVRLRCSTAFQLEQWKVLTRTVSERCVCVRLAFSTDHSNSLMDNEWHTHFALMVLIYVYLFWL